MVLTTEAATASSAIQQIGLAAGVIWHILDNQGPQPISKLVKQADAPRDVVMQALGWLAHEEKIEILEQKRSRIVVLR